MKNRADPIFGGDPVCKPRMPFNERQPIQHREEVLQKNSRHRSGGLGESGLMPCGDICSSTLREPDRQTVFLVGFGEHRFDLCDRTWVADIRISVKAEKIDSQPASNGFRHELVEPFRVSGSGTSEALRERHELWPMCEALLRRHVCLAGHVRFIESEHVSRLAVPHGGQVLRCQVRSAPEHRNKFDIGDRADFFERAPVVIPIQVGLPQILGSGPFMPRAQSFLSKPWERVGTLRTRIMIDLLRHAPLPTISPRRCWKATAPSLSSSAPGHARVDNPLGAKRGRLRVRCLHRMARARVESVVP